MNYPIIFKLLSAIMAALGAAFLLSLGLAFYYAPSSPGDAAAIGGFTTSALVAVALAVAFYFIGRAGSNTMFRKEALTVVGVGWLSASAVGALPYIFVGDIAYIDAFFESASGLTTTGASIFGHVEELPRSLLFWRSISQWFGGLGVVVFFVAILAFLGAGAKILFSRESSAQAADLNSARVQTGIYRILILYLSLSAACTVAYLLCGLNLYEALTHMFTTLSTGGFSTRSASLAGFESPLLEWTAIIFMALGGTSFLVMIRAVHRDWHPVKCATEVKAYYTLLIGASLVIFVLTITEPSDSLHESFRNAFFQVVSIMTTTGYATADFDQWVPSTHILLLMLMAVGGCSGSTGGGVKVVRFVVALRVCRMHIEKAFRARVVRPIRVNGQNLEAGAQDEIMTYLVLIGLTVIFSVTIVALMEPTMSFQGSMSAAFACLFNIGPGFAEVGPTRNFADLHSSSKLFLSLMMIAGRLELYAIFVLFAPSLWKKF